MNLQASKTGIGSAAANANVAGALAAACAVMVGMEMEKLLAAPSLWAAWLLVGSAAIAGVVVPACLRRCFRSAGDAAVDSRVQVGAASPEAVPDCTPGLAAKEASSLAVAKIVHDLRTPLHGILGMAELLLKGRLDAAQVVRIEAIHQSGASLLRIVNDLLDESRIAAGEIRLETVAFDAGQIVAESVEMVAPMAARKGFAVTVQAAEALHVRGDPLRLQQVLVNLLGNAVKFTQHGGVDVKVTRIGRGYFEFEIADTGIGMEPADLGRAFEPFVQASTVPGGTGLGLAIARDLARRMGGDIAAHSVKGVGTTMTLTCRLEEAPLAADLPLRKILVVDDCTINRMIAEALLRDQGYLVTQAEDGRQAVEAISAEWFDAVLMDWHMPVMDGVEATAVVRQAEAVSRSRRLPIIATTGSADPGELDRCGQAGMDAVLPKPFNADDLNRVLGKLLGVRSLPRHRAAETVSDTASSCSPIPHPSHQAVQPGVSCG